MCFGSGCEFEKWDGSCGKKDRGPCPCDEEERESWEADREWEEEMYREDKETT